MRDLLTSRYFNDSASRLPAWRRAALETTAKITIPIVVYFYLLQLNGKHIIHTTYIIHRNEWGTLLSIGVCARARMCDVCACLCRVRPNDNSLLCDVNVFNAQVRCTNASRGHYTQYSLIRTSIRSVSSRVFAPFLFNCLHTNREKIFIVRQNEYNAR